mmetsp:Transcript_35631/g.100878  ORF Transcript_35631/g.100878 Transcript_35631/m.100878 type:complete len:332 (+) Transcript_35631:597-1592(+)
MSIAIAHSAVPKLSVVRVKRRRSDISTDVIILEAATTLQGEGLLDHCMASLGLNTEPDQPLPKRRAFRRLRQVSEEECQDPATALELLEAMESQTENSQGREAATEYLGNSSSSIDAENTEQAGPNSAGAVEYQQAPKRFRAEGAAPIALDPLQRAFHVYDLERLEKRSKNACSSESLLTQDTQVDGPTASAAQSEASIEARVGEFVYDLYFTIDGSTDGTRPPLSQDLNLFAAPVVQVDKFVDEWLVADAGSRSSFDSQDSNDEDHFGNDYPDEEGLNSSGDEDEEYRWSGARFRDMYEDDGDVGPRGPLEDNRWGGSDESGSSDLEDQW